MIRAGIDEAGYGPVLGPLVVALAAFDASPDGSLWGALRGAVRRRVGGRSTKLPVADSKELYQGGRGLDVLETSALAFSTWTTGRTPRTVGEFLRHHAVSPPPLGRYPWYGERVSNLPLPLVADPDTVVRAAVRLQAAGERAGVRPVSIGIAPLLEGEFSDLAERYDSKARVLFDLNVRLIETLRDRAGAPVEILCDRHGGRMHYRELLEEAFPMQGVSMESESKRRSRYRVGAGPRAVALQYEVGGEAKGMEVALASIFAKYTRELFMECLNRHFDERVADLRRTAGYYVDGMRFVEDLERGGDLTADERRLLVRTR